MADVNLTIDGEGKEAIKEIIELADALKKAQSELNKSGKEAKEASGYLAGLEKELKRVKTAMRSASQSELPELRKQFSNLKKEIAEAQGTTKSFFGNWKVQIASGILGGQLFYAATRKIKDMLVESIDIATDYKIAFLGVQSVARNLGQDTSKIQEAVWDLTKDGLMPMSDAAVGLKNLLGTGFNLEQSINLMKAFKDSAAFNRQSALDFGEAIRSATQGLKNQQPVLIDNAGITKNLSQILREYGFSKNDVSRITTDANVRMAVYNGLLKEASIFAGDAEKLTNTYAGSVAALGKAFRDSSAEVGSAIQDMLVQTESIQYLIELFNNFTKNSMADATGSFTEVTQFWQNKDRFQGRELLYYKARHERMREIIEGKYLIDRYSDEEKKKMEAILKIEELQVQNMVKMSAARVGKSNYFDNLIGDEDGKAPKTMKYSWDGYDRNKVEMDALTELLEIWDWGFRQIDEKSDDQKDRDIAREKNWLDRKKAENDAWLESIKKAEDSRLQVSRTVSDAAAQNFIDNLDRQRLSFKSFIISLRNQIIHAQFDKLLSNSLFKAGSPLVGIGQFLFGGYATGSDYINGPGTGTSDSVVARLSRGEAVMTAALNEHRIREGLYIPPGRGSLDRLNKEFARGGVSGLGRYAGGTESVAGLGGTHFTASIKVQAIVSAQENAAMLRKHGFILDSRQL